VDADSNSRHCAERPEPERKPAEAARGGRQAHVGRRFVFKQADHAGPGLEQDFFFPAGSLSLSASPRRSTTVSPRSGTFLKNLRLPRRAPRGEAASSFRNMKYGSGRSPPPHRG